ncbi:MAG: low molecular weight protein arginine phosphatase [Chloroflexi bacterium HGW-Chloroflexi-1]|nr:MAG: low molecular weight protein arginine phosphatase [Chloroflexi bacterium HGW-Chloroflexi-1]
MKTILVVCTANICRSPMATALLRQRIASMGLSDRIRVASAGVRASAGLEASDNAIAVLSEKGIALDDHRSHPVTDALLTEADMVLVMEENHRRSLFYLAPQHLGKVFLLTEMAGQHDDVDDPYGGAIEDYARTAALLEALIDAGMPRILKRLSIPQPTRDTA